MVKSTRNDSKRCTTCGSHKPRSAYYSKGSRIDSSCKECKKQKRRATYVAKNKSNEANKLKAITDIVLDFESTLLDKLEVDVDLLLKTKDKESEVAA